MTKGYNTTQLNVYDTIAKGIDHRDFWGHALRFNHVLHSMKIGMNVLDYGCGKGELCETIYRNRYKCKKYIGVDIRKQTIIKANEKFKKVDWVEFIIDDLVYPDKRYDINGDSWDIISCFEVVEHIARTNVDKFLKNIQSYMDENTILLLSTPIYDEKVGAANNHIYDGKDGFGKRRQELTYDELKNHLEKYFIIEDTFGTFASQRDYKPLMNEWQTKMFEHLTKYYSSNVVSNIMAPFFPQQSRNCLWRLKIK